MRKFILLMHMSLDGFVAGPQGQMNWIQHNEELFQYGMTQLEDIDTAMYGRVTYTMMANYWPGVANNPASTATERAYSRWAEDIAKVVVSGSMQTADWNNTRLIKDNVPAELQALKQSPGRNIMIFGSPRLSHFLMQHNLVDEFRLNINPFALGEGIPLFNDPAKRMQLELLHTRSFAGGVVHCHYRRI